MIKHNYVKHYCPNGKKYVRLNNWNALIAGCPAVINQIKWFKMLQQQLLPNQKHNLIISV